MRLTAVVVASLAGCIPALAVDQVVPLGYESAPGTAGFLGPLSSAQRTYQMLIHSDQLTGLVGQELTGVAFRSLASATSAWPTATTTYTNYDIYLSGSVPPADRSFTFASNVVGTQTQVRSGPLTIPAGSYGFGSSPNAFGPTIEFSQPWLYTGGHLLIEIRQAGSDGNSRSVDAISTSTTGYLTQFSACWASSYTATSTTMQGNFAVARLSAAPATGGCYANCDESTQEPVLNVQDFSCFLTRYAAGESYANCDGSTQEPVLNVQDFSCFLTSYAAGCR